MFLKGKLDEMSAKLAAVEKESGDQLLKLQKETFNLKKALRYRETNKKIW